MVPILVGVQSRTSFVPTSIQSCWLSHLTVLLHYWNLHLVQTSITSTWVQNISSPSAWPRNDSTSGNESRSKDKRWIVPHLIMAVMAWFFSRPPYLMSWPNNFPDNKNLFMTQADYRQFHDSCKVQERPFLCTINYLRDSAAVESHVSLQNGFECDIGKG